MATMRDLIEAQRLEEGVPPLWAQVVSGANAAQRGARAAGNAPRTWDHENAVTALRQKAAAACDAVQALSHVAQVASAPLTDERVIAAGRRLAKALEDLHWQVGFVHGVQEPPEE